VKLWQCVRDRPLEKQCKLEVRMLEGVCVRRFFCAVFSCSRPTVQRKHCVLNYIKQGISARRQPKKGLKGKN